MTKLFFRIKLNTILLAFLYTAPCIAQEAIKTLSCDKALFEKHGAYETKLTKLRSTNIDFSVSICKQMLGIGKEDVTANLNSIMVDVYQSNKVTITGYFSGARFEKQLGIIFDEFGATAIELSVERKDLGELRSGVNIKNVSDTDVYFNTFLPDGKKITLYQTDDNLCTQIEGVRYENCREAFKDISVAFNTYRAHYNEYVTGANKILLEGMNKDWARFIDKARSQTLLDVWATTSFNSGHYKKNRLVSPASTQLFLVHPSLVYEHVSDAPSGEKDKVSIAMEWVGINWWDLRVPIGLSAVSVYSDRPNVSPVGIGAMIYIDNKYTIGWVSRDKGDGIFFSLDILKLFSDKKQQLDQYRNMF